MVTTNLPQAKLNIFPNPATDYIQLSLDRSITEQAELRIVDAQGRVVYTVKTANFAEQIEVANLPAGMYFVRLEIDNEVVSGQFVKRGH